MASSSPGGARIVILRGLNKPGARAPTPAIYFLPVTSP
jgi:hypothetical protein